MNNLQKKIRSRKLLLGVVTGLAAVSVASIGFSSWILGEESITANAQDVTVKIGEVTDNRMDISIENSLSDFNLAFDNDNYNATNQIVKGDGNNNEDLSFSIVVKVSRRDTTSTESIKSILDGFGLTFPSTNTGLQALITADIIQSPVTPATTSATNEVRWLSDYNTGTATSGTSTETHSYATGITPINKYTWQLVNSTGTAIDTDEGGTTAYFKGTFNFAWGSAFNYQNPTRMDETTFNSTGSTALQTLSTYHTNGIKISATLTAYAA